MKLQKNIVIFIKIKQMITMARDKTMLKQKKVSRQKMVLQWKMCARWKDLINNTFTYGLKNKDLYLANALQQNQFC